MTMTSFCELVLWATALLMWPSHASYDQPWLWPCDTEEDLEEWLEWKGLELDDKLVEHIYEEWELDSLDDMFDFTMVDTKERSEFRDAINDIHGNDTAFLWDKALEDLNPHVALSQEEPWLPWNSLLLKNQCSAVGLQPSTKSLRQQHLRSVKGPSVHSDFDSLRSVVVGRADHFRLPVQSMELLLDDEDAFLETGVIAHPNLAKCLSGEGMSFVGKEYPQDVIDAMNDGMEKLVQVLESRGVEVLRSDLQGLEDQDAETGYKGHSARDLMITIGDTLFLSPTPYRSRSHEVDEVYVDVIDYFRMQGGKVIDLRSRSYWKAYSESTFLRHPGEEPTDIPLTETIPLFDAANIFVLNEQIAVYLVSISGNRAGAELLRTHLEPMGMTVLVLEGVYYSSHIDTTILPLSSTKMIYNKKHVTEGQMEQLFGPYGYGPGSFIGISAEDMVPVEMRLNNAASNSIAMNLLQLTPQTVLVEAKQTRLAEILESHDFEVLKVPFPYARDFAGSLHCATCPLDRGEVKIRQNVADGSVTGLGICDGRMI